MEENKIITGVSTDDSVIAALNEQGADLTKKSTPYSLLEAIRISNEEASYKSTNETVVEAANAESPVDYDITLVAEDYSGTSVQGALESVAYADYENALESFVTKQVEEQTVKLESANILATGTSYYLDDTSLRVDLGSDGNYKVDIGSVGLVSVTELPGPDDIIPWTAETVSDTVVFDDNVSISVFDPVNQAFISEITTLGDDFSIPLLDSSNSPVGSVAFSTGSLTSDLFDFKIQYGSTESTSESHNISVDFDYHGTLVVDPVEGDNHGVFGVSGVYYLGDPDTDYLFPDDSGPRLILNLTAGAIHLGANENVPHAAEFTAQFL